MQQREPWCSRHARRAPGAQLSAGCLQHPGVDGRDEAAFFGHRNEGVRRHGAQVRVGPAQQGFDAAQGAVHQPQLGLVMQVEAALTLLLDLPAVPTFDAVREVVRDPAPPRVPSLSMPTLDLAIYDSLLPTQRSQPLAPEDARRAHG